MRRSSLKSYKYFDYLLTYKVCGLGCRQFVSSGLSVFLHDIDECSCSRLYNNGRLVARQATYQGV